MPTFGNEPFGSGRFGQGSWARRVLWGNVPGLWQAEDAGQGDVLQRLLGTWADELEAVRDQIAALPAQRDPFLVRGQLGTEEWLYFESATWVTDATYGPVVVLREPALASAFPYGDEGFGVAWAPYAAISRMAPQWWVAWQGARYRVVNVRTRLFDAAAPAQSEANEVWLAGVPLGLWPTVQYGVTVGQGDGTQAPPVALPGAPWRLRPMDTTGALAPAAAGLTLWYTSLLLGPGMALVDVPNDPYDGLGVLYFVDPGTGEADLGEARGTVDYERALASPDWAGTWDRPVTGTPIVADWRVAGYYVMARPPSLLDVLAKDFGFENDANDPESVQRATIAHAHKYFGLKATGESYRIRGEVSGFEVAARTLYLLADAGFAALLPAPTVHHVGDKWYTTVAPRALRFDDIRADVRFYDWREAVEAARYKPLVDDCFLYEDYSVAGHSTAMGFALDVLQGYAYPGRDPATVVAVRDLTAAEAAAWGLMGGHLVTVSVLQEALADIGAVRKGAFGLTAYDRAGGVPPAWADGVWWIDGEAGRVTDPGDAARWHWDVVIGQDPSAAAPLVGADVALRYWPELLVTSGYCCSNRIRVEITPIAGAWGAEAYFGTGLPLDEAVRRLIAKIEATLVPIHVRVSEYVLVYQTLIGVGAPTVAGGALQETLVTVVPCTDTFDLPGWPADLLPLDGHVLPVAGSLVLTSQHVLGAVQAGATVTHAFDVRDLTGASEVLLTVEQRGDLNEIGEGQTIWLDVDGDTPWELVNVRTGFDDLTWRVAPGGGAVDVTSLLAGAGAVTLKASATAAVANGEVRFTFTITR
jgi:hypothetical protein